MSKKKYHIKPKTKLRLMRMRIGLTTGELALIMGCVPGTISNQERRGIRNTDLACKYAKYLDCNWMELLEPPKQSN